MKKIQYTAPHTITILETDIPVPGDDEVLLRIVKAGICGSDSQIYHGRHKYMTFPVVGGHEASAVVQRAGKNVAGFKPGDRVAIEPQVVCGECWPCRIGRFNVCERLKVLGTHLDGLMAEYFALKPEMLHPCPKDMDFDRITLVEPTAVGVGAVKRSRYKGARILVLGAGTIGNLIAQAAQALGAAEVLVTDFLDAKLDFARACGIRHCANTEKTPLAQAVEEAFGPSRADVIIDAVGHPSAFAAALDVARPSSEIVITGNYKEPVTLEPPRMQRREINLIGHMMYVREDYADAIRLLYENKVRTDGFITQTFTMDGVEEGFKYIDKNPEKVMKAVIEISAE